MMKRSFAGAYANRLCNNSLVYAQPYERHVSAATGRPRSRVMILSAATVVRRVRHLRWYPYKPDITKRVTGRHLPDDHIVLTDCFR